MAKITELIEQKIEANEVNDFFFPSKRCHICLCKFESKISNNHDMSSVMVICRLDADTWCP